MEIRNSADLFSALILETMRTDGIPLAEIDRAIELTRQRHPRVYEAYVRSILEDQNYVQI